MPWSVTWQGLKDHFSAAGFPPTRADVKMGRDGRSRGWGVVKFASPEEANAAIAAMNATIVEGRQITVRLESVPVSAAGVPEGAAARHDARPATENAAYVGNLPWSVTWQSLQDHFSAAGFPPTHADVKMGRDGRSRGWGVLKFASPEEANAAIAAMNATFVEGRPITVRLDRGADGEAHAE